MTGSSPFSSTSGTGNVVGAPGRSTYAGTGGGPDGAGDVGRRRGRASFAESWAATVTTLRASSSESGCQ